MDTSAHGLLPLGSSYHKVEMTVACPVAELSGIRKTSLFSFRENREVFLTKALQFPNYS
jgi:hypothetical protein